MSEEWHELEGMHYRNFPFSPLLCSWSSMFARILTRLDVPASVMNAFAMIDEVCN